MMQSQISPKVTLVGAGPGSKDLITIRGSRVLKSANAILYDALANSALMEGIGRLVPKVYVGKRSGKHHVKQEEINRLLVEYAFAYGHVVRLKGGDPFVFGRASEEIAHVESFGIPVEVVPGVSSAISVPSGQGIPLTKRGVASSFWVMTATKRDGSFSEDLMLASQSSATLVILMGVRKFIDIALYIKRYRGGSTPIALIQNGTLDNESCSIGTLGSVEAMYQNIDISKPGIIVVGSVVAGHALSFEDELDHVLHSAI